MDLDKFQRHNLSKNKKNLVICILTVSSFFCVKDKMYEDNMNKPNSIELSTRNNGLSDLDLKKMYSTVKTDMKSYLKSFFKNGSILF